MRRSALFSGLAFFTVLAEIGAQPGAGQQGPRLTRENGKWVQVIYGNVPPASRLRINTNGPVNIEAGVSREFIYTVKVSVAARTAAPDATDLGRLLDDGSVIRTHVLRPTWHYVAADDVAWLIELTAPRVRRTTQQQLRGAHGMNARAVEVASTAVLDALDTPDLTRTELASALVERGVELSGHALTVLLADLELQALLCSGRPSAAGTHTYARFTDRVSSPRRLGRGTPGPTAWPGRARPRSGCAGWRNPPASCLEDRPRRTWSGHAAAAPPARLS